MQGNKPLADMPREIERKFLIACPDRAFLEQLPGCTATEITQVYLLPDASGFLRRLRKRGLPGTWQYFYTRKKKIAFGERIELEESIPEQTYQLLLREADPAHHAIRKIRYCIPFRQQLLELDVYAFSQELATLEIELPEIDKPVQLPDWLHILADVTDRPGYSNFDLSINLAFPEKKEFSYV